MKLSNTLLLALACALTACNITAVDYAVREVKITDKVKTKVLDKPALRLTVQNTGESPVFDVRVTVKAKRNQMDLSVQWATVERLEVDEEAQRVVMFEELASHQDYDLLTYAVVFSE